MNSEQFQTRLSSFLTQWKSDKRTGDAIFEGIGSIIIPVGKASDSAYTKTAAFQVCLRYGEAHLVCVANIIYRCGCLDMSFLQS